jgi:7-carboxy-7-deazaguanine synthase (Cx14CxxC type)
MGSFAVKEIFLTLQGEGTHAGRAAVFCRFAGCNLWSGRESDRGQAVCTFCDTDFVGTDGTKGGRYQTADDLACAIEQEWAGDRDNRFCVLTGGEPLLQVDAALTSALHARGFEIAVETNGTIAAPPGIDWMCVSPKSTSDLLIRTGNELKLVYPQDDATPQKFAHLAFDTFLLQPMDGPKLASNTQRAIQYCLEHPQWRLSVQTHKHIGIR